MRLSEVAQRFESNRENFFLVTVKSRRFCFDPMKFYPRFVIRRRKGLLLPCAAGTVEAECFSPTIRPYLVFLDVERRSRPVPFSSLVYPSLD